MEYLTILKCATSIYSLMNNMDSKMENKAFEQLSFAKIYLNEMNPDDGLVRQALQHMETAISFLDPYPWRNAKRRIDTYNDLCALIAYTHEKLGDSETIVDFWISKINSENYPPLLIEDFNPYKFDKLIEEHYKRQREHEQFMDKFNEINDSLSFMP